jgi:hypothetical protein
VYRSSQFANELTSVSLLLALYTNSKVLVCFPVDLITLGVVVDEVAAVSAFLLVVVCLGDGFIGEEFVLRKLENKAESGSVKVFHADIGEMFKGLLIALGDHLDEGNLVLHGRKPELWDTGHIDFLGRRLSLLLGLLLGLILISELSLTSFDFLFRRFDSTIHNLGTSLI